MTDPVIGEQRPWSKLTPEQKKQAKTKFRPDLIPMREFIYKVGSDGEVISRRQMHPR